MKRKKLSAVSFSNRKGLLLLYILDSTQRNIFVLFSKYGKKKSEISFENIQHFF